MNTVQIINAVKQLSLKEKLHIIELIFKEIHKEDMISPQDEEKRREAAKLLLDDYKNDQELTAFTALDGDEYYEAK